MQSWQADSFTCTSFGQFLLTVRGYWWGVSRLEDHRILIFDLGFLSGSIFLFVAGTMVSEDVHSFRINLGFQNTKPLFRFFDCLLACNR